MNPPGGLPSGSGPGGSWGPALPHTGLGHTLGEKTELRAGSRRCLATPWLCPNLQPQPGPQSSPNPVAGLPSPCSPCLGVSHHSCSWGSRSPPGSG